MTSHADIANLGVAALRITATAIQIHKRDGHCEHFDDCPFFPCKAATDLNTEIIREAKRVHDRKPFLVRRVTA